MKIGIFTTFLGNHEEKKVAAACESLGVDYEIVDIRSSNWLQNVLNCKCDGFFCPSNCVSQEKKTIQDERYYFVSQILGKKIYPDYTGLYLHESKRNMATWLELFNYPHAKTKVFTERDEALSYLENAQYPLVIKGNVGAGGSQVLIIKSKCKAKRIAKRVFAKSVRWSFLHQGYPFRMRLNNKWLPTTVDIRHRLRDYLIVQDFVKDVQYEWRILKIGDSYFGHQKLLKGDFASGSGLVGWVAPPFEVLDMVRNLCNDGGFYCMDVDILVDKEGKYYINELQSYFGSYADYQMSIDGKHGRFVWDGEKYNFEEGDFNVFGSNKLKVEHFMSILNEKNI